MGAFNSAFGLYQGSGDAAHGSLGRRLAHQWRSRGRSREQGDDAAPAVELTKAYVQADFSLRLRYVRIALGLFLLLMPTFAVLDWNMYPEHFAQMLQVRLFFDALFVGILLFTFSPLAAYIKVIGAVAAILAGLSISWMVAVSEGALSPYYAGLNLILVVMSVLLPWTFLETAVVCAGSIAIYVGACFWRTPELWSLPDYASTFLNNMFFLGATSVICMTASHYQSIRRFQEFRLRFELDIQNAKLSALDREKTNFFANVSHELRTPLTLILAPVQELLEGGHRLPDAVASRLGVVRDNSLRLLKLVNDLLDVIRMEEGKFRLELVAVDLNAMVNGVMEGMVHLADTKNIQLDKRLDALPLIVRGDIRAIEKILVNIVNNAVKFTGKGGRILVETDREATSGVIRVSDTGIGIAKDDQPHIFERFHQVDGSSTRRFRGTGLGLALVREMTERMGGAVDVISALGEGTTMSVRLPLAVDEPVGREAIEGVEQDGLERLHRLAEQRGGLAVEEPDRVWEADTGDRTRPRVLVVEDEPDMRRYLADLLEGEYHVLLARTGAEGLKLACERRPDLVLLDLMLPEMDGLEVCRRIREEDSCRGQKVMLLTARVDERSKITALEHGADDFLTKPFSSVEVKTRLRNLLVSARLERDLLERNASLQTALANLKATQAQLIHSEKLNALGGLAAGLLHEINNPLNYSLTALQLIRRDRIVMGNELLHEVVADIDEGMQRIRTIVTDLRAFAYPSEADKELPFDFREALESALRFTSRDLSGIKLLSDLPANTRILASKSHITQVLVNLLVNAAKAIAEVAAERGGEIRIAATANGGRLHVRVADNGVGMDAETLERIFEPFFTTRDVGDGVGLGLSICHTIVANHGGRLLARSRRGEGTELEFDLPMAV